MTTYTQTDLGNALAMAEEWRSKARSETMGSAACEDACMHVLKWEQTAEMIRAELEADKYPMTLEQMLASI